MLEKDQQTGPRNVEARSGVMRSFIWINQTRTHFNSHDETTGQWVKKPGIIFSRRTGIHRR